MKGRHTAKYLVTVTPSGQIMHVSSGYRGKASDKFITLNEKLLENFSANEAIIVDKGFEIYKECTEKGKNLFFR